MKRALALAAALVSFCAATHAQTVTRFATGPDPRGIVVDAITNKVYVANHGANYLTVLDAHARTTKSVTVGNGPEYLLFDPEVYGSPQCCNMLWVANTVDETVSVVSAEDDSVIAQKPVGASGPMVGVIGAAQAMLRQYTVDEFMDINTAATGVVQHTGGTGISAIASVREAGNGTLIVLGHAGSNEVVLYRPNKPLILYTHVPLSISPVEVAIDPIADVTYALGADGRVAIIDNGAATSTTVSPAVASPANPKAIAVNPFTSAAYALYGDRLVAIDGATHATRVLMTTNEGQYTALAVDPATNRIFATNDAGFVEVVDGATGTLTSRVQVAAGARGVAVNPATQAIYVVGSGGTLDEVVLPASWAVSPIHVSIDPLPGNRSGTRGSTIVRFQGTWPSSYNFTSEMFAEVVPVGGSLERFSRLGTSSYTVPPTWTFDFTGLAPGDYEIRAFAYAADPLGMTSIGSDTASVITTTPVATYRFTVTDRLQATLPATLHRRVDFDGDGDEDVLLTDLPGTHAAWLMNGTAIRAGGYPWSEPTTSRRAVHVADMDGDGHSDVVALDATGETWIEYMNGTQVVREKRVLGVGSPGGGGFFPYAVGDFDGDGIKDILFRHPEFGYSLAYLNADGSPKQPSVNGFGPANQEVVGVADVDGNGTDDIFWWDGSTVTIWLDDNGTWGRHATLANGNAVPVFLGDFNGDGVPDIVWRGSDGSYSISLLTTNGNSLNNTQILAGGSGWEVIAVADLDGDHKSDLVWRNTEGSYSGWLMDGTAPKAYGSFIGGGTGWEIVQTADLDGDGQTDLIWRGADGTISEWIMGGLRARYYGTLLLGGNGWNVTP